MKSPYSFAERTQSPPLAPSLRRMPFLTCQPSALPLTTQPSRFLPLKSDTNPSSLSSARATPASATKPMSVRVITVCRCMGSLLSSAEQPAGGCPAATECFEGKCMDPPAGRQRPDRTIVDAVDGPLGYNPGTA